MSKERFGTPVAVFILVIKDNQILLHRRQNTEWQDGKLDTPSGHLEKGETVLDAGYRELIEETGLIANTKKVAHTMHCRFGDYTYFQFYIIVNSYNGEPQIKEQEKCSEMGWYSLDSLPEDLVPYVRQALDRIQKNEHYSEYGWD